MFFFFFFLFREPRAGAGTCAGMICGTCNGSPRSWVNTDLGRGKQASRGAAGCRLTGGAGVFFFFFFLFREPRAGAGTCAGMICGTCNGSPRSWVNTDLGRGKQASRGAAGCRLTGGAGVFFFFFFLFREPRAGAGTCARNGERRLYG